MHVILVHATTIDLHGITTAHNPVNAVKLLQFYSPVPVTLLHSVISGGRSLDLEKTLHIKYQAQLDHSFWFRLSREDVSFIQSINTDNITKISGLIKRELKKPVISTADLPAFIHTQLEICSTLLKGNL